jgi:hypothetical protein
MHGACEPPYHSSTPASAPKLMDVVGHGAQIAHIALVPDARRQAVRVVRFGVDRAIFGIDPGPAALGLQRAVRRLETRPVGARADAMRHLVEPVAQRLRPNLDGLKQNIVFGIARHTLYPLQLLVLC